MPTAPKTKRAVGFFDGQNLYRHAKSAFGHHHPNHDPQGLFNAVCKARGWQADAVRFYTGVPPEGRPDSQSRMWHGYWKNRIREMSRSGILVTRRYLRYHDNTIVHPDGPEEVVSTPHEKGIDLRIGLDVVRLARTDQYDVAVIFSQDQDLTEVADEVREISKEARRWIKIACAFPSGPDATSSRGINGTEWVRMDRAFYDQCLDPRDYRPVRY